MNGDEKRLKAIGARVLGEANDLKRTPEALALELGRPLDEVQAVIAGTAPAATAERLLLAMTKKYPVSLADLWVEADDTDDGVRIMSRQESEASSRIFSRPDRTGAKTPYYQYRDTAMSRTAPFKPEWIEELRVVTTDTADDPDVAYNRGHFLHQTTFFIGPVNFYWQVGEKRHAARLDTGDSNYITPFVPHSFTSREANRRGLIIAVTYAAGVSAAMDELSRLGAQSAQKLAGDLASADSARSTRLARHLAMESLPADDFVARMAALGMAQDRARKLLGGAEPANGELALCASALHVRPADLLAAPAAAGGEVVVKRRDNRPPRPYPNAENAVYLLTELARTPHQPQLKGFAVEVVGTEGGEIRHGLHEYIYNYGECPVTLFWGEGRKAVLEPGASAYVRPMVRHRFARTATGPGQLVTIRVPGALTDATLDEFAAMAPGRHRALAETERWF